MVEDETNLKDLLVNYLSTDFLLQSEVTGKNLVDSNQRIRIDFLAQAKTHIISAGFTPEIFGIEVKYIVPGNKTRGQINKVFWQSVTYSQSIFKFGQAPYIKEVRPCFVFVFINTRAVEDKLPLEYILAFCQYSNVGQLILSKKGYSMKFGGGSLFSKYNNEYRLGQVKNIGTKRYVGNTKGSKVRERTR